jgi:hypothetical protein
MELYPWIVFLHVLVAGVIGGFMGAWWGEGWIWAAIGVLLVHPRRRPKRSQRS